VVAHGIQRQPLGCWRGCKPDANGTCEGRGDRLLTLLAVLAHVRGAEFDGER
jgi:hypothetical protein